MGPYRPLTPAQMNVILLHPWRYGGMVGEWGDSFSYARVVDYASRAAFSSDGRLICIVGPAVGLLEPSSEGVAPVQLIDFAEYFISFGISLPLRRLV